MQQSILQYQGQRYLWWAVAILLFSIAIYLSQGGAEPANGGTWQGYVLGGLGAFFIVLLSLLGVRKRRYSSSLGKLQGWASSHVYIGTVLLIVATLHCALQFGLNVHTLAYVLMCLVIFSGFYGLYVYMRNPSIIANVRSNQSREGLLHELNELEKQCKELSAKCDGDVQAVVKSAVERTALGGGVWLQITGADNSKYRSRDAGGKRSDLVNNKDQVALIKFLAARIPDTRKRDEAANLQDLLGMISRRQVVLRILRRDIQLQAQMKIWLFFHVPLTMALLVALSIHVLTVFYYW